MRVCAGSGATNVDDADGNHCNWTGGGLGSPTPKRFFGGCGATGAGTLCCKN